MAILNLLSRLAIMLYASMVMVAVLASMLMPGKAIADESLEYGVKAAFLYKFAFYVEWPSAAFPSPSSPINLCVAGADPFGASLEKVIGTEGVNGRNVAVRRIKAVERDNGCHILYISASEAQQSAKIMETVRGTNVLTVSDNDQSKSVAGIIDFVIVNNRVRFNIDDELAAQSGLVISSKLMSLALNAKRRNTSGARK